jgi:homopolymeric O-antigen transport system permease protein
VQARPQNALPVTETSAGASPPLDTTLVDATQLGALRWLGSWELILQLAGKDLKLKYRGSVFGFLWSLVNPLVMLGVYTLAFSVILRVRTEGFVFFLFTGLLAWTFFAGSATMSAGAVADHPSFVKSATFPRGILPVASVVFNLFQYLLTTVILYPVMLVVFGHVPGWPLLAFPLVVAVFTLYTVGVALLLSTGTAFYRDIRHFLDILLAALFWTTPIIYDVNHVPEALRHWLAWLPVAPFVIAVRDTLYYGQWPSAATWLGCCLYAVGTFAIGSWVFAKFEDRFAERI